MDHPETHTVTLDNGPRPAGKPDRCFYCNQCIGELHTETCVLRNRTVVVRAVVEYVVRVPSSWSVEDILFHRNDSSWCKSNLISELERIDGSVCLCGSVLFEFVREATVEDELAQGSAASNDDE